MDVLSLAPMEVFYYALGRKAVYLRANRLLKIQSFWGFFKLLDRVISSPHAVRFTWFTEHWVVKHSAPATLIGILCK